MGNLQRLLSKVSYKNKECRTYTPLCPLRLTSTQSVLAASPAGDKVVAITNANLRTKNNRPKYEANNFT